MESDRLYMVEGGPYSSEGNEAMVEALLIVMVVAALVIAEALLLWVVMRALVGPEVALVGVVMVALLPAAALLT